MTAADGVRPGHAVPTARGERSLASAITRNPNLREQLYHARSAAHAYEILHADDARDFNYFLHEQMAPSRAGGG